jgi:hypothetical protein
MKSEKVAVSERALLQRLNRRLRDEGIVIKKARGERAQLQVGDYFALKIVGNYIVDKDCDLEELGKQHGALQGWEEMAHEN